jgi:cyclophilin family peptidyl-prolyl cis-trans isomerase
MTLVPSQFRARRLATVGLVALLVAGCTAIPTITPTPSPTVQPTIPPSPPPFTFGPTVAPGACPTTAPAAFTGTATVTMTTNYGTIVIKVDGSLGANAAGSFVALSRCGYYNNVVFHRVVSGFIIQGGDGTNGREPNLDLNKLGAGGPDWNVPDDKVTTTYKRGTVSLARTSAANSGNSQFFIVLSDSAQTTLGDATANNYAIFGSVTTGMDVVDRMALVPLGGEPGSNGEPASMPLDPIVITGTSVTTP